MRHTIIFVLLGVAFIAEAHVPLVVTQRDLHDIVTIDDVTLSQAFYGKLDQFPHTYQFIAEEKQELFVELLVPDIESSTNNVSAIIIKEAERKGRVIEVARLHAKDAAWESFYEPFGGDSYRRGPRFEAEVESGTYRIEVHTPDNVEKYVLVVGKREESGGLGYLELLGRIAEVKLFFEKSRIRIIESPLVYVPITLLLLVGGGYLWYRRRRQYNGA